MQPYVYILISVVLLGFVDAVTEFQCWNHQNADEIRARYLDSINLLRRRIANGVAENKVGSCPQGKNIYRLYWDCYLEMLAQDAADSCNENVVAPRGYSLLIKNCNPIPLPVQAVNEWWNVVKTVGLGPAAPIFSAETLRSFAILANGKTTKVGCAHRNCNEHFYMACVTSEEAPVLHTQIYETGIGCTYDSHCSTYSGSKCLVHKLCRAGYVDSTINSSVSTTTTSTTTSTASTTTPVVTVGRGENILLKK